MTASTLSKSDHGQPVLPGRLADPQRVLRTDPRTDPRILTALAPFGLDKAPAPISVHADSTLEERLAHVAAAERGFEGVFEGLFTDLPPIENVERRTEVILGVDENPINLYIHTPTNAAGAVPCAYHIHGGGMVLLEAAGAAYRRWRDELCAQGMVVVGAQFFGAHHQVIQGGGPLLEGVIAVTVELDVASHSLAGTMSR